MVLRQKLQQYLIHAGCIAPGEGLSGATPPPAQTVACMVPLLQPPPPASFGPEGPSHDSCQLLATSSPVAMLRLQSQAVHAGWYGADGGTKCNERYPAGAFKPICGHVSLNELDGQMSYKQALAYWATGDEQYAHNAFDIINSRAKVSVLLLSDSFLCCFLCGVYWVLLGGSGAQGRGSTGVAVVVVAAITDVYLRKKEW